MIDIEELTSSILVCEYINDLINDGFSVTINRHKTSNQYAKYVVAVNKRIKEDDFTEDELTSMSVYDAVLQAWDKYSNKTGYRYCCGIED